jgi:hypothetical protein
METPYPQSWTDRVGAFAAAVGKTIEEVTEAFMPLVGEPGDEAIIILGDASAVPDADIKEALKELKIPSGKLNMHLAKLRPEKAVEEVVPSEKNTFGSMLSILPTVPNEESFLEMLRTGGVLKVDVTEVISAIKAGFYKQIGIYDLVKKLSAKMDDFAKKQEEPNQPIYYELEKLLTEKQYGDILSALGVPGKFVNESRKTEFFVKLDAKLWTALKSFHNQLVAWQDTWIKSFSNPAMFSMTLAAQQSGSPMPAGMMSPPQTTVLEAAAEEVINEINRIFAGNGIPIARALAYDATRIIGILENKDLPAQIGAANKDQMIKELGISVGAEIIRMEKSLTQYALSIMSLAKVNAGKDQIAYLSAMLELGMSIPWDKLGTKGIGSQDLR